MAQRGGYKQYTRQQRQLDVEDNYSQGISYVDSPLPEGMCKLAVNFEYLNMGETLRPRGGMEQTDIHDMGVTDEAYHTHHVGSMYIVDVDNDDAVLRRYILTGKTDPTDFGIDFSTCVLFIEDPDTDVLHKSTLGVAPAGTPLIKHSTNVGWRELHGLDVSDAEPLGTWISMENNTYVIYKDGSETGLGRLRVELAGGAYTHQLEVLTPKEITPSQAVNYGYNMLLDDAYQFSNAINPAGTLDLQGLLPYDPETGALKFNAQANEEILFKLIYKYPSGAGSYQTQWEVRNLEDMSTVEILLAAEDDTPVTAGDPIEYIMRPPFKQFSVTVRVFDSTDLTHPIKVMTLASYYLTEDEDDKNKNLEVVNYSIPSGTGMAKFMNRAVVWGVSKARSTLFMSAINDPTYFPFPHSAEPIGEDIVHCIPLLDNLLVFTETRLHVLTPDWVTGGFTRKVVQENLNMNYYDRNTIKIVRNMVYFKSNNYYYMVVPNNNAGPGELQLAPISQPIERLLDDFEAAIEEILDEVYNVDFTLQTGGQAWTLTLQDFYNYLDNSQMKNVYKYSLQYGATTHHLEVVLAYDTLLRNWSLLIWETNTHRLVSYRRMVTENTIYANIFKGLDGNMKLQRIQQNNDSAADTFKLDNETARFIKNYQMLDTGKRAHMKDHKKTFREIQVVVNNLTGTDLFFYTNFLIDDSNRKPLFKYTTEVVDDPQAPNYGQIYVDRSYVDPEFVQGTTALGVWRLGLSSFPPLTVVKVRIAVDGKGYSGRLKLLSINEIMYELLNHNWVYRLRNAR